MLRARSLVVALALVGPATAQSKTEKHPELGITFSRHITYEPVPIRPATRDLVLQYTLALTEEEQSARKAIPTLMFYAFPDEDGEALDVERYLEASFEPREMLELRAGRKRYGHKSRPFKLEYSRKGVELEAYVHAWVGPERTVVIVGSAEPDDYDVQWKIWRRMAESIQLRDPEKNSAERARLERFYGQRRFSNVDYRIEVRLDMVAGWDAKDTENYLVLYHLDDPAFVEEICLNIEALRREYIRDFPPTQDIEAVSTVRVCRDREEYLAYGGLPTAIGYWSAAEGELVLHDARGREKEWGDTLATLYHEAFHQFIFYSTGGLSPHSWFDEGTGEYYAGAVVERGRLIEIGLVERDLWFIQDALRRGETTPWEEIVDMSQSRFYSEASLRYSQAWSMIHFLRNSPEVARHPKWRQILPTYFGTLQSKFREQRAVGQGNAYLLLAARDAAVEDAFEGVDFEEIEAAWATWVRGLTVER